MIDVLRNALAWLPVLTFSASASAQVYVNNTIQIPQGGPFNFSRTENVDFGDVDLDGDLDVVMADGADGGNDENRIWVNLGGAQGGTIGFFEDRTAAQFPPVLDQSRDIELADIDADGDLDVLVANNSQTVNQPDRIWVNQGGLQAGTVGFFVDETAARWVGLGDPSCSIAPGQLLGAGGFACCTGDIDLADLDADGDLDLVQGAHGLANSGQMPTRLFLNDGLGHFTEHNPSGYKLAVWNIADGDPALWAQGLQQANTLVATGGQADVAASAQDVDLADVDGDLDLDLLLGDVYKPTRLFDNQLTESGSLVFRDVTGSDFQAGYLSGNGHYEQEFGDLDDDGDLDLYGLCWFDNQTDETLENVAGTFRSQTVIAGSLGTSQEADFGDYDNDGDLDVYIANFAGDDRLYRNQLVETGQATLTLQVGQIPGLSNVAADADFGDIDNDGDQDVLIGADFDRVNHLLENVTQVPDTHAPRLEHLEQVPDRTPSPVPTRVRVHVYDNAAYYTTWYATVELEHRVNAGPWSAAPMRSSGGQVFRGELPGTLFGAVEYRVRATDASGNVGLSVVRSFTADNGCYGDVTFYCTSKTTSLSGCLPSLVTDGVPSASAPSGFTVSAVNVPGGTPGLFLYTTAGPAAVPQQTAFGLLCIQSGPSMLRVGAQAGSGTSGGCDGGYAIDFNAFMATQTQDPALVAGATVDLQCWYRDPPNVGGANFTSAVGFVVCP